MNGKILAAVMYIYMIIMIVPIYFLYIAGKEEYVEENMSMFIKSLLVVAVACVIVLIIAIVHVFYAIWLYHKGNYIGLRKSMTALKLWTIPFYLFNFVYSALAAILFTMGLQGIGVIFVPVPIIFTCTVIFLTGFFGIFYVKYLRKNIITERKPSFIHYFMQLISVLDSISTFILLRKYKKAETIEFLDNELNLEK